MRIIRTFCSAIVAGICIGIAGCAYLTSKDIVGALLFTFGLLTVVHYGLKLYTGTAGFITRKEVPTLLLILLGNIVGCFLVSLVARCSPMPLQETAQGILESRLRVGPLKGVFLSTCCGFIMTTAVTFARKEQNLPLIFGVPLFIICGFPHCIADAFYYLCVPMDFWRDNFGGIICFYANIVIGNFVGCNLYRMIVWK